MLHLAALALFAASQTVPAAPAKLSVPPILLEETIKNISGDAHVSMQLFAIPLAPPGRAIGDLPGHRHAGHIYAYVLEGAVRSKLDDGPEVLFSAGQGWIEEPGQLHRILNPGPAQTARLLVVSVETGH